jgi:hypothetical protein
MSLHFSPIVVYHVVRDLRRGKAAKLEGPTYGNSNPSVATRAPCAHHCNSRRTAARLRAKFARVFANGEPPPEIVWPSYCGSWSLDVSAV